MLKLVAARLAIGIVSLLLVSAAVFAITALLPGDVATELLGQAATPEAVAGLRAALGLDLPAHLRYVHWLTGLFTGDAGRSLVNGVPVSELIGNRLPNSLMLAGATAMVSVPLALTIGITAAMWRGTLYDRVVSVLTLSVVSVPEFLVATGAVLIFAVHLRWLSALSAASVAALTASSVWGCLRSSIAMTDSAWLKSLRPPHFPRFRARRPPRRPCRRPSGGRRPGACRWRSDRPARGSCRR